MRMGRKGGVKMKKNLLVVLIPVMLFSCHGKKRIVEVYGRGEVKIAPDFVDFKFSVVNTNAAPELSQKINMKKSAAIIEALKKIGIKESNIFTLNYSLSPEYHYARDTQVFDGYKSENNFLVRLTEVEKYQSILSKILALGVNRIDNIEFGVKNFQELKSRSLSLAISNARDKAMALAKPVKLDVSKPLKIFELDSNLDQNSVRKNVMQYSNYNGREEANIQVISKGERLVVTNVLVRFELD